MLTYSEDTVVRDVRIAIDENTETAAFKDAAGMTYDTDTLEMEEIVKSKIPDAVNAVRMAAPLGLLEPERTQPQVTWDDGRTGTGRVTLPSDFLRLALFRMSDWQYGVSSVSSPAYYRQMFSAFAGCRGNPARPAVFIVPDGGTGDTVLQFFSCDSTDAAAELLYVRRASASGSYQIEESVYRAVVLKSAALVMAAYSSVDMMRLLNAMCGEQLGIVSEQE